MASGRNALLLALTSFGSYDRWICDSLMLAQISQGETSHIPETLGEILTTGRDRNGKKNINIITVSITTV